MTWIETNGQIPRIGEELLYLKFRNGLESKKSYPANRVRWSHVGDDWDVMAVARG